MRTATARLTAFAATSLLLSVGLFACAPGSEQQRDDQEVARTDDGAYRVVLYQYAFEPEELTIEKGDEIAFTNKDPDRHNVSIPALDVDEDVSAGETFAHTFETGGEFAVSNKRSERPMRMTINVE